ncbi:MAG TPA: GH3 auxin-responsive promoter family protein, partial [Clostridia bacterium]|nr:GH3 auxin-responsive promoter family protein [Clostridia bacterium]
YATGLLPLTMSTEMDLQFFPPIKDALKMSFTEQNRVGFRQSMQKGVDLFFGMSSIIYAITKNFNIKTAGGEKRKPMIMHPLMLFRVLLAKYRSYRDGTPIYPKDIFRLNGLICVGNDSALFKDELERAWGCRPLEIAGGTEPTCLATETWKKDGLVFFPDACFYEFIPEGEMLRSLNDPSYTPRTFLMDELVANENYELVITVLKGGAFMRYRVGDVYRCLRLKNEQDGIALPQFEFIDRIPTVIDIAGFTRITQRAIEKVIRISRLPIADWCARKQYDDEKRSFMHMYVEIEEEDESRSAINQQLIREHMGIYFKHYDHDYNDLKRFLGVEPLQITLLKRGTLNEFSHRFGRRLSKINPPQEDIINLLYIQNGERGRGGEGFCR